jgi:hypothetical protein
VLQGHAVQKLHHDERLISVLADLVDSADIGMIQSGCSASLAAKTCERLWVFGHIFGKKLQSDEAAEVRVLGLVDHTHAAATQLLQDAVVRNGLAEHVVLAYRMSIVGRKSGASQRSTLNTRVSVGRMMKTYNAAHPHARISLGGLS